MYVTSELGIIGTFYNGVNNVQYKLSTTTMLSIYKMVINIFCKGIAHIEFLLLHFYTTVTLNKKSF